MVVNAGHLSDFVYEVEHVLRDLHYLHIHNFEDFSEQKASGFDEVNRIGLFLLALEVVGLS